MKNTLQLRSKLVLGNLLSLAVSGLCGWSIWFSFGPEQLWLAIVISAGICFLISMWLTQTLSDSLSALEVGLLNFKDNEFSVSLHGYGEPQLDAIAELYNQASQKLRNERQFIYQRELMLDKVIQNSPNIMLLVDDNQRIIYANDAARHLFNQGVRIEGMLLSDLIAELPHALKQALDSEHEGLFSIDGDNPNSSDDDVETWHISRGKFSQNNQQHHLILLKQLTKELNRQEVAVWKKVIRIISHELNNSVAPIASMVNSGRVLTKDVNNDKLELIFDTIENRTAHLSQFISHYAEFAKLPLPRKTVVNWDNLIEQLAEQYAFKLNSDLPTMAIELDCVQLEQVLINLLKNAHESGADKDKVSLSFQQVNHPLAGIIITIEDNGSGMSSEVLSQALLPFYSTKQSGTGIGLPLCREIVEAHGGHITMQNRAQGGLSVKLWLPKESVI
ncbi:ATP-binding protein [Shewanella electrodiphila]|uniref:histidine kinase n=1 Tax=Shewanella electrodiphila TaxID=934143 RepID=A0ABT0KLN1_9GAMM|nr:ATP-binding protein [Shewanella electrodiphila]MCL1044534.1 ATP-binding protein [Shewanella electrodiphila]